MTDMPCHAMPLDTRKLLIYGLTLEFCKSFMLITNPKQDYTNLRRLTGLNIQYRT